MSMNAHIDQNMANMKLVSELIWIPKQTLGKIFKYVTNIDRISKSNAN